MKKQLTKSARQLKEETVDSLSQKVSDAKTIVFANYHGLNVNQISQLRKKIKESGGEMLVTKNTLVSRALAKNQLSAKVDQISGPTATVFAYEDELAPIKILAENAKLQGIPKFKFGFFGKDFLDEASLEMLAKIPSKQQLQANIVGTLASPLYGIVSVLSANIRNLLSILDQLSKKEV